MKRNMGANGRSLILSTIVAMICWTPSITSGRPTDGKQSIPGAPNGERAQLEKYPIALTLHDRTAIAGVDGGGGGHLAKNVSGIPDGRDRGAPSEGASHHQRIPRMVTYATEAEDGVAPSSLVNVEPLTPHQMRIMLRAHDDAVNKARAAAREREQREKPTAAHEQRANDSDEVSAVKRKSPATSRNNGLSQHGSRKRWIDLFGGSSVESRFPLPERRQFPEVDWRGFNEDVFHESFGDFSPVKRWRRRRAVDRPQRHLM